MENLSPKTSATSSTVCNTFYENFYWNKSKLIIGVDEVGRGCLAGPVVACALVLFKNKTHRLLKDSKVLSQKKLYEAADWIKNNAWYTFGMADHTFIDQHNIYNATLYAMQKAYYGLINHPLLMKKPTLTLIDAMPLKVKCPTEQMLSFCKGESKSISIAAASIMAKTMRDTLMEKTEHDFPQYEFISNKGYGSAQHYASIKKQGISLIHRKSFLKKVIIKAEKTNLKQSSFL